MKTNSNFREKMLDNPVYWVEGINGLLYDAIVTYMENNNMKKKDLAKHLGISAGRVSQILNDGDINFSLEKIVEIALKVDKFPSFVFENKASYLERERKLAAAKRIFLSYNQDEISMNFTFDHVIESNSEGPKIIPLNPHVEYNGSFSVTNELTYGNG